MAYQWRGPKKKAEYIPYLDQSAGGGDEWYTQFFYTWEELFEKAYFKDGVRLIDAMAQK